jgi:hypothetical protein
MFKFKMLFWVTISGKEFWNNMPYLWTWIGYLSFLNWKYFIYILEVENYDLKVRWKYEPVAGGDYHPRYLGDWDQEVRSSRPGQANSWLDTMSKITRAKWTRGMA